jgi:hypothetical protein
LTPDQAAAVVARLRSKYVELLGLRDAHARGEEPPDLRARLRALAAAYPGALRELDRLPRAAIVARLAELEGCSAGAPLAPWMLACDRVHHWLRVGLAMRAGGAGDERLRRPPGGRLVPVVLALVADELGLTPGEVASLVLPPG